MAHPLDTMSEAELTSAHMSDLREYARAEFGLKVHGKTRSDLVAEIMSGRTAISGDLETVKEPGPDQVNQTGVSGIDPEPEETISPSEARKFDLASDRQIEDWIERNPDGRPCLVNYAWLVLERRQNARNERAKQDALESQVEQFAVVKGGFIVVNGYRTSLPTNSVVARHTHNIEELQRQGIAIAPIKRVSVERTDLGLLETKIEVE